ncbi:uncharacterized protein LOC110631685 isoform X2 [Hevea brasiliensis]|uniref:uncharacterized protein LOC110631685 isoform X2 n=1 Tax=Hevea brasiliensis TaxID=3981 RepID=UPI0025FBBFE2|nr:uncharacterized protein LOC110631685 isoform X2 [Hevea brasiliensis]
MISILAQERLLGTALGIAFVGFVVFEQRKRIYESISADRNQLDAQSQLREPIFGKQFRSQFELMWNKAVDETFRPVVASLNSQRTALPLFLLILVAFKGLPTKSHICLL